MRDRILKFITHEGLTATKFADEIGVQRSSVSHILSGRNNPGFEFIQKILLRYRNINAEWLIMGTGSMFKKIEQQSLFQTPPSVSSPPLLNIPEPKVESNVSSVLSPILSSQEDDKKNQEAIPPQILASRRIEKILVFYSDKTFDEYIPSK
jgi:transcriptional regulator with XRE-family HTH domain